MYSELFKGFEMTPEEERLIQSSYTSQTSDMNQTQVVAQLYLIKNLENIVDKVILSNKLLAESNDSNSKTLNKLTLVMVFVAIAQVILLSLSLIFGKS